MNLEYIKDLRSKITQMTPGENDWFMVIIRKNPRRIDIFSGPKPVNLKDGQDPHKQTSDDQDPHSVINPRDYAQVLHVHPFTAAWNENNPNGENDARFCTEAPRMIDFLLKEIEKLKGENS